MWPFSKDSYIEQLNNTISKLWNDNRKLICENKQLKAKYSHTEDIYNPHYTPIEKDTPNWYYFTSELLKKDTEIQKLNRTLRQYEQDEKEMICKNNNLEDILREKLEYIKGLENELKVYKEFFAGNTVNVILKDSEPK